MVAFQSFLSDNLMGKKSINEPPQKNEMSMYEDSKATPITVLGDGLATVLPSNPNAISVFLRKSVYTGWSNVDWKHTWIQIVSFKTNVYIYGQLQIMKSYVPRCSTLCPRNGFGRAQNMMGWVRGVVCDRLPKEGRDKRIRQGRIDGFLLLGTWSVKSQTFLQNEWALSW